ncbi:hypothetical protein EIP86_008097 [Pleurotus ostreatoroseus]|nr:hypothetical protein EIP86_008097 [Pleurotus ostreatoroseus]
MTRLQRATATLTKSGFVINVEDARTLLATAYIFADIFDEYEYNIENAAAAAQAAHPGQIDNPALEDQMDGSSTTFEFPLNILVETLNLFGTAGSANTNLNSNANANKTRRWKRLGDMPDEDDRRGGGGGDATGGENSRIDNYFKSQRGTGMRISYAGPGAEDNGNPTSPTATCEITTFEPEPHVELPFDIDDTIMKIILKSSWLRDALSEIDPSCEKLTIIGHPPPPEGRAPRVDAPPRLRLKAVGVFGSTEVRHPLIPHRNTPS